MRLFGHDPAHATVELLRRSRSWRTRRAVTAGGAGLLLAPFAALVPPHVPWALGVVGVAAWLARRRWREHATLLGVEGPCPRCGAALAVASPTPLRHPHRVPCETCHHEVSLEVVEPGDDGEGAS